MNILYSSLKLFYTKGLTEEANKMDIHVTKQYWLIKGCYEDELHVLFSRRIVSEWLSYIFLAMGVGVALLFYNRIYLIILLALSLIFFLLRCYLVSKYLDKIMGMRFAMTIMQKAVYDECNFIIDEDFETYGSPTDE